MLKIHVTSSKKIGQPDYGSLGATVGLEAELDSNLITDPHALRSRLRQLFDIARAAVDAELQGGHTPPSPRPAPNGNDNGGDSQHRNGRRGATDSQLRAIRAIAKRLGIQPENAATELHGCGLDEMTLPQASQLIDHLKSQQSGGVR